MPVLASIPNIKIPYAVEGIIRTAQLDDTISPEDSVQLAVNMNFDRVGAIQTRLGITQYAPTLAEEIKNYGVLRNARTPDGYDTLIKIGETATFTESIMSDSSITKIDDSHVIIFWTGVDNDGFVQVMETNLSTGGLIPIGTPLEFDIAAAANNKCIQIDATHYLNIWSGSGSDAFAQVFLVNATTWAVTAIGTPFEFDTSNGFDFSINEIDANHFIVFYGNGDSNEGLARVLEVNLSTFAVTAPAVAFAFTATGATNNSSVAIGNGTHFINFWNDLGATDGLAQVFSVDTGTWLISAVGSPLSFDGAGATSMSASSLEDGEHFIAFWTSGTTANGESRVFNVDPGTFAVTAAGSQFTFQIGNPTETSSVSFEDGEHVFVLWAISSVMYSQIFEIDPGTFTITAIESPLSLGPESSSGHSSVALMSPYRVIGIWRNDLTDGVGSMLRAQGDIVFGRFLYAGHGDDVSNWDGVSWTSRRSALAQVSKPRFAQYLNYLWMVNGNETIGGDPVATSNGGAFGTDLVPDDFPKGDFISAGFEGRVWVADNYTGTVYYTDIVQFTPPDVYTLTYNPDVNFITTIAPQTGEVFTALYEVPERFLFSLKTQLLVFMGQHLWTPILRIRWGHILRNQLSKQRQGSSSTTHPDSISSTMVLSLSKSLEELSTL